MKIQTTYLSKLDAVKAENEQLSSGYRDLCQKYIRQERNLTKAIRFIERQSGSVHYEDLQFARHGLGDFRIRADGTVDSGEILLPPNPFNEH